MTGRVHSLQSMGTVDGPGVRYVVFMQGCPLRCAYCHNPDTWAADGGEEFAVEQIVERVLRVREYLSGGVTVTGGEPLTQPGFVRALFERLKYENIHTALDTSGCLWSGEIGALLDVTDLALLDLKMNTDAQYREHIGISIEKPLAFLRRLDERNVPTWIRQVVVPGIHDAPGQMDLLRETIAPYRCVEKVELLPFRKLCLEKYRQMGIAFPLEDTPETTGYTIERLYSELNR